MCKKIKRVLSLLLCLAMLLSAVACKSKNEKGNKTNPKKEAASSVPAENEETPSDLSSDLLDDDLGGELGGDVDGGFTDNGYGNIVVERPYSNGGISKGVKVSYSEEENLEGGEEGGDINLEDDIDNFDIEYTPLLPKNGKKVSGAKREIKIDNSANGIVFTDFSGLSANVFPTGTTLHAQNTCGDGEVFLESNGERFNDVAFRYGRAWFEIDWIVTEEAGDNWVQYVDNPDANPDYQNYMNGIYCFSKGQKNTDHLNSAIQYFKMMEEAGTEVYLAFGWKVGDRVHHWFADHPTRGKISAPRDLKAYAKAAAALYKYMRNEVGLTNFNTLSFYNEPDQSEDLTYQGSWDYVCLGDKCVYWTAMATECQKEFDKHKDLKDVRIIGADCSNNMLETGDNHVNPYMRNNAPDAVDCYSFHYYGYSDTNGQTYTDYFDKCVFIYNYYEKPCYITEYYTAQPDINKDTTDGETASYAWTGWDRSLASLYIATANTGVKGGFKWTAVVGALPDGWGTNAESETGNKSWMRPVNVKSINKMYHGYYQEAMLNNYVPNHANVHDITWTGDDIRATAFTSENGKDFSLVVEANEDSVNRTLSVNLQKSLGGKTIYVYRYGYDQVCDGNAIIPLCNDEIKNVKSTFSYSINGDYGLYVLSTIKPLKQVALYQKGTENLGTAVELNKGESVTISPKLINCDEGDTVKWEIKRSNGGIKANNLHRENLMENNEYLNRGTLTQSGNDMTYTVGSNAEAGDIIAIRCTIEDGDTNLFNDRYAVTTIFVK